MGKRQPPFSEPSDVAADRGIVIVDGPDGIAYAMEPEAAEETSHRLHDAAATAQGQRVFGLGDRAERDAAEPSDEQAR